MKYEGKTYRAGMFGGVGVNSMHLAYLDKYGLPHTLRENFKDSIKRPAVCGSCLSDLSVIGKFGGKRAFAYGGRDFSLHGGARQPNEHIECDRLLEFVKTIAAYAVNVL